MSIISSNSLVSTGASVKSLLSVTQGIEHHIVTLAANRSELRSLTFCETSVLHAV